MKVKISEKLRKAIFDPEFVGSYKNIIVIQAYTTNAPTNLVIHEHYTNSPTFRGIIL